MRATLLTQYFFLHIKYTSNMAACYVNDVNDVSAPHVYLFCICKWHVKISKASKTFSTFKNKIATSPSRRTIATCKISRCTSHRV